jgi:hypothetical protein
MSEQSYPFSDPPNTACFTCSHVLNEGADILYASHDADDGMWQFLCGAGGHTVKHIRIVGLGQILKIDPGIARIGSMPIGICGERDDRGSSWRFARRNPCT